MWNNGGLLLWKYTKYTRQGGDKLKEVLLRRRWQIQTETFFQEPEPNPKLIFAKEFRSFLKQKIFKVRLFLTELLATF